MNVMSCVVGRAGVTVKSVLNLTSSLIQRLTTSW